VLKANSRCRPAAQKRELKHIHPSVSHGARPAHRQ